MNRLVGVLLAFAVPLAACAPRVVRATHSLPASVQIQMLRAPRTWIAGFVGSATAADDIDINLETVRILSHEFRRLAPGVLIEAEPLALDNDRVFDDENYWRRMGEEHRAAVIVTGVVRLTLAPALQVQRGRRTVYLGNAGRALDATVVLIDGRTGDIVDKQPLRRRTRYLEGGVASGLALYFALMDEARADWLQAIFSGAAP